MMGLFRSLRRSVSRTVSRAVSRVTTEVKRIGTDIEGAVKQAAPFLALVPGPVGAAARAFTFIRQIAGKDTPDPFALTPPAKPIGLVGKAAQSTRQAIGPAQAAQLFPPQPTLPARSAFPFAATTIGGGFSAPSRAAAFPPGAGSTARGSFFAPPFSRQRQVVSSAFFGQAIAPLSTLAAFGIGRR